MKFSNKIITLLFVFALAINTNSCQQKKDTMEWKIIDFNKIPGEKPFNTYFDALNRYKFNQIVNYNKDIFFLLGDDSGENPDNKTAVIYKSLDFGKTFHKNTLGKGSVTEGSFVGKDLYVIIENRNFVNGVNITSSTLFLSKDFGETWKKIKDFDNENIYGINFYTPSVGVAFFLKNDKPDVRFTSDGGISWKSIDVTDTYGTIMFISSNVIQYINNNQLISYNLNSNEKKIVNEKIADYGYECDGYIKDDFTNEIYFHITEKSSENVILKNEKTNEKIILPQGCEDINIYNNLLYTVIENGTYYDYVWSNDMGDNWHVEKLSDFFLKANPISYYGYGNVYSFITLFKGSQEERGARLAVGQLKK